MPNELIKRKQDETGISKKQLEKLWEQAKAMTAKKNLSGNSFFAMLNSIFDELVKNIAKKESMKIDTDKVICEFIEYLDEETVAGDVAQYQKPLGNPDSTILNRPCFNCDDDLFYKIGFTNRKRNGWYNKFYGTNVGEFARKNPKKDFYIKHSNQDMLVHIKGRR